MSVFFSDAAREAPRFTAVVVFPTPPFWLAMAMMRAKFSPKSTGMYQNLLLRSNMFHVKRWFVRMRNLDARFTPLFHVKPSVLVR